MKNYEKRLLIAAGILTVGALGFAASSYFLTKKLVKIALERDAAKDTPEMKKARDQLRGYEEEEEILKLMEKGKSDLLGAETETVSIKSYDGTELIGHFYPVENAERVIVAMHGWRSSWAQDFGAIASFWHESRCSVLFCEQRGHGLSGGAYMGFGLMERFDCKEWVKWIIEERKWNGPIYLAGVSMGAATVLMSSSLPMPENVCGIISDCAFTSPHDIWKHVVENNLRISYGIHGIIANDLCRRRIQMGSKDFSTVDAVKESKIPTLFIHGSDDHFVPVEMTYENYKACAAPKRLLIVPGADHSMSYFVNKEEYERKLLRFFYDFDIHSEK